MPEYANQRVILEVPEDEYAATGFSVDAGYSVVRKGDKIALVKDGSVATGGGASMQK